MDSKEEKTNVLNTFGNPVYQQAKVRIALTKYFMCICIFCLCFRTRKSTFTHIKTKQNVIQIEMKHNIIMKDLLMLRFFCIFFLFSVFCCFFYYFQVFFFGRFFFTARQNSWQTQMVLFLSCISIEALSPLFIQEKKIYIILL